MQQPTCKAACLNCRFFLQQGHEIEKQIPGLASLGSAFGAHIGNSKLCTQHDCLTSSHDSCQQFQALPQSNSQ